MFMKRHNSRTTQDKTAPTTKSSLGTRETMPGGERVEVYRTQPRTLAEDMGPSISAEEAGTLTGLAEEYASLVEEDSRFAEGKMDSMRAQKWLDQTNRLIVSAHNALDRGDYAGALAFADAAGTLAGTVDMLLAQTLGIVLMPSYKMSAQYAWSLSHTMPYEAPIGEQVRLRLLCIHEDIIGRNAAHRLETIGGSYDNISSTYVSEANSVYRVACDAYLDGNYRVANDTSRLAEGLLRVADKIEKTN